MLTVPDAEYLVAGGTVGDGDLDDVAGLLACQRLANGGVDGYAVVDRVGLERNYPVKAWPEYISPFFASQSMSSVLSPV